MKNILKKIDLLAATLKSLSPLKPEYERKLAEKFRMEFNYNSNHLEGNTLTYGETKLLLIFDKTQNNHEMREYEEMRGSDVAYLKIKEYAADKERPLTEADIKELNKLLLVRPFWKDAITAEGQATRRQIKVGEYKEFPNSVRLQNGEMFHYASPMDTPIQMQDLMNWFRNETQDLHPVEIAALFHYKFVCIHPFDDGNGRISRLLMNYVLSKYDFPPVIIKSKDKKNYLFALNQADTGNIVAFQEYIAKQLIWSLEIAIKAAKGENIEEEGDLDKKISLLERKLSTIDEENEVKLHFNKEVFMKIYEGWLSELIREVVPVIQKFDKFFEKTQHYIAVKSFDFDISMYFNEDTIENILSRIYDNVQKKQFYGIEAFLISSYKIFIKGGVKTFDCGYSIKIEYSDMKYLVLIDEFSEENLYTQRKIERLLHQPLTSEEIKEIAHNFGETIYKHIEYHIQKNNIMK